MSKTFNRRDIIKLVGGGLAGMVFTPIPWKLLDDLSIWTQNWSWIPVPLKGEINSKYSICTICPAGCAVRARCVAGQPVSLWGVKDHPVNNGALCPLGFGGHHLAFHPARIHRPVKIVNDKNRIRTTDIAIDDILSIIHRNIKDISPHEYIAVLDNRPGRTISLAYRKFLAETPNGMYLASGSDGMDTLEGLQEIIGDGNAQFGFNTEKAKTIVSFGAPLLEGWGIPGRTMEAMKNGLKLIQIETRFSHTSSIADSWLPVKPGTEAILALGIAHVLLNDNLIDTNVLRNHTNNFDEQFTSYKKLIDKYPPKDVARITGIKREQIVETAREIAANTPSLILCGREPAGGPFSREEQTAIWGLNFLLGNIGPDNLIVPRRPLPYGDSFTEETLIAAKRIAEVPDNSIKVLIIDESESGNAVPWKLIERKLIPGQSLVISLSPYLVGYTKHADYVVPAPTHLESYQDLPTSFDAQTATYAVSAPLYSKPEGAVEPYEFLKLLAKDAGIPLPGSSYTDLIKERAGEIYATKRGWIYTPNNGRLIETAGVFTGQQFWSHLNNGGYWIDEPLQESVPYTISVFGQTHDPGKIETALKKIVGPHLPTQVRYPLTLIPFGWRGVVDSGPVTPLITKLYQESEFRKGTNRALIHPETGRIYRLRDGRSARITTDAGELVVQIEFNDSVMPDIIHVALGPDQDSVTGVQDVRIKENVLSICSLTEYGTWRTTPAHIATV